MRIAFALNMDGEFEKTHFGDADKYCIYNYANGELNLLFEEDNQFKSMDEESAH